MPLRRYQVGKFASKGNRNVCRSVGFESGVEVGGLAAVVDAMVWFWFALVCGPELVRRHYAVTIDYESPTIKVVSRSWWTAGLWSEWFSWSL